MVEYLIQDTTLTALADEIRELSGTTTPKSLDAMTSDIDAANTEIAEQAELLNQIATALEGKASGESGGVKTCTVTIEKQGPFSSPLSIYGIDSNGSVIEVNMSSGNGTNSITTTSGILGILCTMGGFQDHSLSGAIEHINTGYYLQIFNVQGDATIIYNEGGN